MPSYENFTARGGIPSHAPPLLGDEEGEALEMPEHDPEFEDEERGEDSDDG